MAACMVLHDDVDTTLRNITVNSQLSMQVTCKAFVMWWAITDKRNSQRKGRKIFWYQEKHARKTCFLQFVLTTDIKEGMSVKRIAIHDYEDWKKWSVCWFTFWLFVWHLEFISPCTTVWFISVLLCLLKAWHNAHRLYWHEVPTRGSELHLQWGCCTLWVFCSVRQ